MCQLAFPRPEDRRLHASRRRRRAGRGALLMLSFLLAGPLQAETGSGAEEPGLYDEVWRGLSSSFALPLHQFLDGTAPEALDLRLAFDMPLRSSFSSVGKGTQGDSVSSPTVQLGLRYMPLENWFFQLNLLRYVHPSRQRSWEPDFVYSFGYDDWRPYTLSLVYSNSGANRLNPDRAEGEKVTRFNEGTWSLGFKLPLPRSLKPVFLLDDGDALGCTALFNYAHRYFDAASNRRLMHKRSTALACRYSSASGWYFDYALHAYPSARQKQPWDPDYTYGLGYGGKALGGVSVQYGNYSGNRYPWNPHSSGTGRLRDGSLTIAWNTEL